MKKIYMIRLDSNCFNDLSFEQKLRKFLYDLIEENKSYKNDFSIYVDLSREKTKDDVMAKSFLNLVNDYFEEKQKRIELGRSIDGKNVSLFDVSTGLFLDLKPISKDFKIEHHVFGPSTEKELSSDNTLAFKENREKLNLRKELLQSKKNQGIILITPNMSIDLIASQIHSFKEKENLEKVTILSLYKIKNMQSLLILFKSLKDYNNDIINTCKEDIEAVYSISVQELKPFLNEYYKKHLPLLNLIPFEEKLSRAK